jgi:hypothetical protein
MVASTEDHKWCLIKLMRGSHVKTAAEYYTLSEQYAIDRPPIKRIIKNITAQVPI